MTKKYIIEIAERHTHYTDEGKLYNLYRVKGFNSLVLDDYGLKKLEKYKESNGLDLYKKVFEILSIDYFNSQGGFFFDDIETLRKKYLEKAKEELENGK